MERQAHKENYTQSIEIARDWDKLNSLVLEWNSLPESQEMPFLRHEWILACAQAFHENSDIHVIVGRKVGRIGAILPLVIKEKLGVRRFQMLSYKGEPSGILFSDTESLKLVLAAALNEGHAIFFGRLWPDVIVHNAIREASDGLFLLLTRDSGCSPWLAINGTWDEYETSLTAKQRYDLRRAYRRAREMGDIVSTMSLPDAKQVPQIVQAYAHLEAAGWKGKQKGSLLHQPERRRFHELYWRKAAKFGLLRVAKLEIDGSMAACLIATELSGRFWVHRISYYPQYSRCSPGIILMHDSIRYAFEAGLKGFEFLGRDEPWIHLWTKTLRPYVSLRIYPVSFTGMTGFSADILEHLGRKLTNIQHAISRRERKGAWRGNSGISLWRKMSAVLGFNSR